MLDLSPETETLAHRLAEAQRISIDDAVRGALEAQGRPADKNADPVGPSVMIAQRRAALERAIAALSTLSDLDTRSATEIMDDIDPL